MPHVNDIKISKRKRCDHRNAIKTSFGGWYCPTNLGGCGKDVKEKDIAFGPTTESLFKE